MMDRGRADLSVAPVAYMHQQEMESRAVAGFPKQRPWKFITGGIQQIKLGVVIVAMDWVGLQLSVVHKPLKLCSEFS